jgi:uncharacterized protein YaiE (UPF0345 family)
MLINSPNISGSLTVTGNATISGSLNVAGGINATITGSATSASYVEYSNVANKPTLVSGSAQVAAFGFATTGSNQFNGSQAITGSLTVTGQVIAQTLNVQQVTSSIVYSSGSNIFGSSLSNTQQLTGSVSVTGSLTVNNTPAILGSLTSGQVVFGTAANTVGGDSGLIWDNTDKRLGVGTNIPQQKIHAQGTGATTIIAERTGVNSAIVGLYASQNPAIIWGESTDSLRFAQIDNTALGGFIERWRIGSTGILQSNGAQTIQTSTGNLTLATAGGNGNILLSPNGTGKVGIGTTSVGSFDSVPLLVVGGGTADSGIAIFTSNATAGYLQFADGTSGAEEYRGFIKYDHSTNAMSFSTNSTARTEAEMTILGGGNVGIGTASPTNILHVVGTSQILQQYTGSPNTFAFGQYNTSGDASINNLASANLLFATNNTERMRITSAGNVGIGTDSPLSNLHVRAASGSASVRIQDSTNNTTLFLQSQNGLGVVGTITNHALRFDTNDAECMRITSTGNVGIGTDSPAQLLHLYKPSGSVSLALQSSTNYGYFYNDGTNIGLASNIGSTGFKLIVNRSAPDNSLVVNSAGNVGIGTDSPRSTADVNGILTVGDGNPPTFNLYRNVALGNNASFGSINFGARYDGTNYGIGASLSTNSVGVWSSTNYGGNLIFATTPQNSTTLTERMRITSGGNVGIGTTSPATKLHVVGSQTLTNSTGIFIEDFYSSGGFTKIGSKYQTTNNCRAEVRFINPATGADSDMSFAVSDAGNNFYNAMYIKGAGGNVGIGTTAPNAKLQIVGDAGASINASVRIQSTNSTAKSTRLQFETYNNLLSDGLIDFVHTAATAADHRLSLGVNTPSLHILGNSNVGIGTTSPTAKLEIQDSPANDWGLSVWGNTTTGQSYGGIVRGGTNNSDVAFRVNNAANSATFFSVRGDNLISTGTTGAAPYNNSTTGRSMVIEPSGVLGYTSSTRESKANIQELTNVSWLYNLKPVSFNYRKKDDEMKYTEEFYDEKWYGLIADEVESINEDLVFYNTNEDGYKELAGVEYQKITSALIKSIQELKSENDNLKSRLEVLEQA